ncbi:MAG: hypothetical protein ABSB01_24185 [Streptosporangiaceae bacterium]|jgi:hypothetical protein
MAGYGHDPDLNDPRVQEEIREAVKRARGSALGSYMSEQDLANAAGANFSNVYGHGASTSEINSAIRREIHRQGQAYGGDDGDHPPTPSFSGLTSQDDDYGAPTAYRPASSAPAGDPVGRLVTDHWFTDAEMYSLRHTQPYSADMWQYRYDPSAQAEYYRGFAVALVSVVKMIGSATTQQRYREVVDHVDRILLSWPGTSDQIEAGSVSPRPASTPTSEIGCPSPPSRSACAKRSLASPNASPSPAGTASDSRPAGIRHPPPLTGDTSRRSTPQSSARGHTSQFSRGSAGFTLAAMRSPWAAPPDGGHAQRLPVMRSASPAMTAA